VEGRVRQPILNIHLLCQPCLHVRHRGEWLSGLARGAVLFVLIFFFQGPYGLDPHNRHSHDAFRRRALGSPRRFQGAFLTAMGRYLATGGLLIDAGALIGMATIVEHDAVLGAGRFNGSHRGWIGHLLVAKYERGDERRAAERAWCGVRYPDDGPEYRSDARYRDRIPPRP